MLPHADDSPGDEEWRHSNIGRLMNCALTHFEERVFELLAAQGHSEVRLAHLHLTRNLDRSGTRTTELARRAAMTKQAMSEIVAECESIGLVRRMPDPLDARAKIVLFTDAGLAWLNAFKSALARAEAEMRQDLGETAMRSLKKTLARYDARREATATRNGSR